MRDAFASFRRFAVAPPQTRDNPADPIEAVKPNIEPVAEALQDDGWREFAPLDEAASGAVGGGGPDAQKAVEPANRRAEQGGGQPYTHMVQRSYYAALSERGPDSRPDAEAPQSARVPPAGWLPEPSAGIRISAPAVEVSAAEYDRCLDVLIAALPAGSPEASRLAFAKRKGHATEFEGRKIFVKGRF